MSLSVRSFSLRSSILACLAYAVLSGSSCETDRLGAQCSSTSDCQSGLVCVPDCADCVRTCRIACQTAAGQCILGESCQPLVDGGPAVCSYGN